ncbi:hypothetical protein SLEP1_g31833 [Rubroshorea leprosula]|uniref:Uncharacterized protein n=1 Tax=Rubroshorea leprosula TaxID=152421 RepID=A0AAV5KBE5_9ROSI|nr:hypothetical protein SLEP1_g31833 [Rubroshorea leprosula]
MGNCLGSPSLREKSIGSSTNHNTPGTSLGELKNYSNTTELSVTSSSNCRSQFSEVVSEIVEERNPDGQILERHNLKIYTFAELKNATRNFKSDTLLGEGGFGRVFKGWVNEKTLQPSKTGSGMLVAIKKLSPESMQGLEEWRVFLFFSLIMITLNSIFSSVILSSKRGHRVFCGCFFPNFLN